MGRTYYPYQNQFFHQCKTEPVCHTFPDEIASVAKVKEEKAKEIYDFIKENF